MHSICLESEIGECKLQLQIVFPIPSSISDEVEDEDEDDEGVEAIPHFSCWLVDQICVKEIKDHYVEFIVMTESMLMIIMVIVQYFFQYR